ncbi:MAG: hypothetical protein IJ660_06905 [Alphaproteobacteria bacterium]|nr:hypothetical protein [Alphaproteobacteria bacterium]
MQKDFSYPLSVDDISTAEKEYKLIADTQQQQQIAEIFKVQAVKNFQANIYTRRHNKSPLIDVWGYVEALITRQSVISLENFDRRYKVDFSLQFDINLTENQVRAMEEDGVPDIPDVVQGGQIDLCHLAMEQIALELEDYPRQDGEEFTFKSEFDTETDAKNNPFNVLKKLKK